MRQLPGRVAAVVSAVGAGLLLLLVPVQAHAAPGNRNLAVNPTHGPADAVVTAVYTRSGAFCGVAKVTFRWDGKDVNSQLDHDCSATAKFRPPNGRRDPGTHQVEVVDSLSHTAMDASYTIDGAGNQQMMNGGTQTPGVVNTANDPQIPLPTADQGGVLPSATGMVDAAAGTNAAAKTGWTSWALVAGAVLVLGGVGILAVVMTRMRRERIRY